MARQCPAHDPCPTCGHTPHPKRRTRSDFERNMDFWAARDAYRVMPGVVVIGAVLVLVGIVYLIEILKWLVGA